MVRKLFTAIIAPDGVFVTDCSRTALLPPFTVALKSPFEIVITNGFEFLSTTLGTTAWKIIKFSLGI